MGAAAVAAGVGAVGSIAGGLIGASGAQSAADTQAAAINQGIGVQKDALNFQKDVYGNTRSDLAPYRGVGQNALYSLASLYGLPTAPPAAPAAAPQPVGPTIGPGGLVSPTPAAVGQGQMIDPTTGKVFTAPTLPDGQTLQYLGTTGVDGAGQPGYWAIVDQAGNIVRGFAPGSDLQTVNQLIGPSSRAPTVSAAPTATPGAAQPGNALDAFMAYTKTPFYQFPLEQGQLALDRTAAAKGLLLSGGQLKDSIAYNQGYASQGFGNYLAGLRDLAGLGQNSSVMTGTLGNSAGGNMITGANGVLSGFNSLGATQASGIVGGTNAITGSIGQLTPFLQNIIKNNSASGSTGFIDNTTPIGE